MNKKITATILSLSMLASFAACSKDDDKDETTAAADTEVSETDGDTVPTGDIEDMEAAPTGEYLAEMYFRPIAQLPQGTAGASLQVLETAYEVYAFAADCRLDMVGSSDLGDALYEGWLLLTEEEQNNFDNNIFAVNSVITDAQDDWESAKPAFEDVDLAEQMEAYINGGIAEDAWDTLFGHTITLGNSDDSEPYESDAEPASDVQQMYDELIGELRRARNGELEEYMINNLTNVISIDTILSPEEAELYYTMLDLDGNGVDEMFIYQYMLGSGDELIPVIYDGYTVVDGELIHFINGGARNSYYLAADGSVYNMGSAGAAYTAFSKYTYANGDLTFVESYFSDDNTGEYAWYYSQTDMWSDDRVEVSEDEAFAFTEFEAMYIPNELAV